MTRLLVPPRSVPGWVQGLVEDAEPGTLAPGTIEAGENFVPTPAGRQRTRGGSRIMLTLKDDAGPDVELSHVCVIHPFTTIGALIVGYSAGEDSHYAYRVTADMDYFTGTESTSRHDMTASPSTSWANLTDPARPVMAEIFEKMFIADATTTYSDRNEMLSIDSSGTILRAQFVFGSGAKAAPRPYCVEEYNSHLFMAGYGSEDAGDADRPELLRHSFLGRSPDDETASAEGFHTLAFAIIGAKGQRITAMRTGRNILLVAKENEFHRISGYGRAYDGWQFQIEQVQNTQGLGITNPKALIYAEGWWWGVSAQGPIRSDGFSVELLVGPRKPSWRGIDNVEDAWVAYHPERRLMLFGLHPTETESGRSTTFPWRVWAWDILRDVWQPDHEYGADLFHGSAITTTTAEGPSGAPSSPSTTAETTTGYQANWTNGDATAQTEFWEKLELGGTWTLASLVPAGTAIATPTSRVNHSSYYWRVRHRKNGITSDWDVEAGTIAQTLIAVPGCVAAQIDSEDNINITLTQNAGGTDLVLEIQVDGGGFTVLVTFSSRPSGSFVHFDGSNNCGEIVDYRARSRDASWPADSLYSATSTVDLTVDCSPAG